MIGAIMQQSLVPSKQNCMYRLIHKSEEGLPIVDDWLTKGHPPLMISKKVDKVILDELKNQVGQPIDAAEINKILVDHM